jgi:hypothetical protein
VVSLCVLLPSPKVAALESISRCPRATSAISGNGETKGPFNHLKSTSPKSSPSTCLCSLSLQIPVHSHLPTQTLPGWQKASRFLSFPSGPLARFDSFYIYSQRPKHCTPAPVVHLLPVINPSAPEHTPSLTHSSTSLQDATQEEQGASSPKC